MVRDTVDKVKCVVVFDLEENKIEDKQQRERVEKDKICQVISVVAGDEDRALHSVEESYRIGKYEENKQRPVKIKFATQAQAEEVLRGAWKLSRKVELQGVWINRDLDEEERVKQKELVSEAKEKNDIRTEEEQREFYWKVVDLKLIKKKYRK